LGLLDIFYCLKFETSLLVASYNSQHLLPRTLSLGCPYTTSARTAQSHCFQQFLYYRCSDTCLPNRYLVEGDVSVIMSLYYLDEFQMIYKNSGRRKWPHHCFRVVLLCRSWICADAETNDGNGRVRLHL
jgi:hypothetical protein